MQRPACLFAEGSQMNVSSNASMKLSFIACCSLVSGGAALAASAEWQSSLMSARIAFAVTWSTKSGDLLCVVKAIGDQADTRDELDCFTMASGGAQRVH